MENQHQEHHAHEGYLSNTLSDRLGRFADRYWPVFVITFGAAFIFCIPFHTWYR